MQVKQHLTRHLLENVVACPECGHGFKHQSDLRTHFNLVHNKTILCDFPDCTYVSPSPSDLVRHKEAVHVKSLPYKCIMEECERRFSGKTEMLDHFFFYCVQPDWVFCQDCKYRCYKRSTYNDHWTDTKHLKNVEILESRGIQPSPPTFNLNDEIKKASLDPAAYKAQYCSAPLLGISSVPIFNIKGIMETVEPFRGFIPHSGILPKGTIWCSDTGVAAINQCNSSMLHNKLCGPRDFINIPVPQNNSLIDFVTYQIPIMSTTDCTTEVFTYILLCAKHPETRGTRGVGMSLDQPARQRFHHYECTVKTLTAAREKEEERLGRELTFEEFAKLDIPNNTPKHHHFAAKDCSVSNMVFAINSTFTRQEDEDEDNEGKGRRDWVLAEAYYSYAIESCHEASGGIDEEEYSEQIRQKV